MTDSERLEHIRRWVLLEAEHQFSGKAALELGSPLNEALSLHIADHADHLDALAQARQSNVRLLLGAVHYLLLAGRSHRLADWYPTVGGARVPDAELPVAFDAFVGEQSAEIHELLTERVVQTNEVRRCSGLYAAFTVAASLAEAPLSLIEVGCSAGVNLVFDRYFYRYSDGRTAGEPSSPLTIECRLDGNERPPLVDAIPIASRMGIDHEPVNLADEAAISWMRACIWGDHPDRLASFDMAVEVARADPPYVKQGDMIDALPAAVASAPEDSVVCVYHTSAVNYLSRRRREEFVETVNAASHTRRVLHLSGEGPGVVPDTPFPEDTWSRMGVPLVLGDVRDGTRLNYVLAVAGTQGGWLDWRNEALTVWGEPSA